MIDHLLVEPAHEELPRGDRVDPNPQLLKGPHHDWTDGGDLEARQAPGQGPLHPAPAGDLEQALHLHGHGEDDRVQVASGDLLDDDGHRVVVAGRAYRYGTTG
jgi:hypothetical protein